MARNVIPFQELRMTDVEQVGGKNASLGEMISQLPASVRVPGGFATTADAYRKFLSHQGLAERIRAALESLDVDDVVSLARCGAQIRQWIVDTPFPAELEAEIKAAIAVAIGGMVLRFALVLGVLLLVGLFARGALATAAISFLAAFTLYVGLRLFMYPMTPPRRPGQARSR